MRGQDELPLPTKCSGHRATNKTPWDKILCSVQQCVAVGRAMRGTDEATRESVCRRLVKVIHKASRNAFVSRSNVCTYDVETYRTTFKRYHVCVIIGDRCSNIPLSTFPPFFFVFFFDVFVPFLRLHDRSRCPLGHTHAGRGFCVYEGGWKLGAWWGDRTPTFARNALFGLKIVYDLSAGLVRRRKTAFYGSRKLRKK